MFVRWSSQVIESDDVGRLPGLGDTVVRRFDAPEALDMRFHEVRTKSALNRVPAASRVPFNWTVNPYRGCSHACVYCTGGGHAMLLADGGVRPMADLRPGDRIYGTRGGPLPRGDHRVLDALADAQARHIASRSRTGREILASGDHRFLSRHGWGYVASEDGVSAGRPATERLGRVGQSLGRHLAHTPRPWPGGGVVSARPSAGAVLAIGERLGGVGSSPRARPRTPTTGAATCAGPSTGTTTSSA